MKKIRTIKIIKSASANSVQTAPPEQKSRAKSEKACPIKVVEGWVSEHQERRLLAEQIALKLLYEPGRAGKRKDEFSNR